MTAPTRSGIPTTYRGTNFRSRLEARWAAMFDLVGWSWTYEPLDADGYIPDFLVQGKWPMFVEVGACITREDFDAKSAKARSSAAVLGQDLLVVGVSPLPFWKKEGSGYLAAGLLGEWTPGHDPRACDCPDEFKESSHHDSEVEPADYAFDWGVWGGYDQSSLGVYHCYMSYTHRPAATLHEMPFNNESLIERLWAEAGNRVQWRRAA